MWGALLVGGALCLVTFYARGGRHLETTTATEMGLTIGGGVLFAASLLLLGATRRRYGSWTLGLMLALTALTALSIGWSVSPEASWRDASRMLAYTGVLAGSIALVRLFAERWAAVLGGITLAAVVVCAYGLATKVFPSGLPANAPARLQEPFGYWNAIGLTAAMGVIGCMWLGARRRGHALLSAMAYPACGLLLLVLLLAYSRGALAALAVGAVVWLAIVPLRLRGASVLLAGMLGAGAVAGWDFSRHALSSENVPLAQRAAAGHELGALALVMVLALALAGMALTFFTSRRAPTPRTRRRTGIALWALVALAVLALVGGLAASHRGLTGSVSHAVSAVTNPNAKPPPNTPGRLTAVASVRARYWKEALQVFGAHPALGAGAEGYATARLRYRKATLVVVHAHGFVVQTLADLGIVGLLVALALLGSWIVEARRSTMPLNRPPRAYTPERVGLLTMLCIVVVFGAHSLIDWTWYIPGNACVALLCAGWLAGRGPLGPAVRPADEGAQAPDEQPAPERARPTGEQVRSAGDEPRPAGHGGSPRWRLPGGRELDTRLVLAGVVVVGVLLAAWMQWQPQRSEEARAQALALAEAGHRRASVQAAHTAVSRDPVSAEARFALAAVQSAAGLSARARDTLQEAVRLQPSNPQTWLELARYDMREHPRAALRELRAAVFLNPESIAPESVSGPAAQPESIEIYNRLVELMRRTGR
ncbi:MAG TPA: O-antigen ligase family protein [Solirubrobacteraceae bacterium]|nr:O-antigen ligase family protein [Solirubrobacteraceae bacterium]